MIWDITKSLKFMQEMVKKYSFDDHYNLLNTGNFLMRAQSFSPRNKKKIIFIHLTNILKLFYSPEGYVL